MSNQTNLFQVAVEAIIEKDGKILITKRAPTRDHMPNEWETLTGRLNQGESFLDALHREVYEETKLKIKPLIPIDTFQFMRVNVETVGVSYWCKYLGGEVILDTDEQVEYRWVDPQEAIEIIRVENIQKTIQRFSFVKKNIISSGLLADYAKIDTFFKKTYPEMSKDVRLLGRLTKITEELGELTNEVHAKLGFHKASTHKHDDLSNLAKEWADVFNTVILMGIALDLDINQVITARMKDILNRYNLE